jgi:hypothetical protein
MDWPPPDRLMRVTAPHFVAGALWRRSRLDTGRPGQWHCVKAAPIIGWMLGKPLHQVWAKLNRDGWGVEWLSGPSAKQGAPLVLAPEQFALGLDPQVHHLADRQVT